MKEIEKHINKLYCNFIESEFVLRKEVTNEIERIVKKIKYHNFKEKYTTSDFREFEYVHYQEIDDIAEFSNNWFNFHTKDISTKMLKKILNELYDTEKIYDLNHK